MLLINVLKNGIRQTVLPAENKRTVCYLMIREAHHTIESLQVNKKKTFLVSLKLKYQELKMNSIAIYGITEHNTRDPSGCKGNF